MLKLATHASNGRGVLPEFPSLSSNKGHTQYPAQFG